MSVGQDTDPVCRQCGAALRRDAKFCRACGSSVPEPVPGVSCPRCRHINPADSRFCRGCGTALVPAVVAGPVETANAVNTEATQRMPAVAPGMSSVSSTGVRKVPPMTLIAVIAVLVAAGGAGVALVLVTGGKSRHAVRNVLGGAKASTGPTESEPATASSSTAGESPKASAGGGWPSAVAGYTVALASDVVPSDAEVAAAKARSAGLSGVGVLWSSRDSSLRPGYWFVFSGVYSTASEARGAVPRAVRAGFADAYVRRVAE